MKTYTFTGQYATGKLRGELIDAGIPAAWDEGTSHLVLVVQQEEDAAVAVEEPVLDDVYEFVIGKDGQPTTELNWYRLSAAREPVTPDPKIIPDGATNGTHIQLGDGHITVQVPNDVTEAAVKKVVDAHDPTPPAPEPSLEERIRDLEDQLKA